MNAGISRQAMQRGIRSSAQAGGAAVEFAFVLPLLLFLTYSVIVYAYVFVLRQAVNFAAQEAAQSALAVDPAVGDEETYKALVALRINNTVNATLGWLPESQRTPPRLTPDIVFCSAGAGGLNCPADDGEAVVVKLKLDLNAPGPLLPVLRLPGLGAVPPLPDQMTAVAVVRL